MSRSIGVCPGTARAVRTAQCSLGVVKGVSDFATPESRGAIAESRVIAAKNAAEFTLDMLTLPAEE